MTVQPLSPRTVAELRTQLYCLRCHGADLAAQLGRRGRHEAMKTLALAMEAQQIVERLLLNVSADDAALELLVKAEGK